MNKKNVYIPIKKINQDLGRAMALSSPQVDPPLITNQSKFNDGVELCMKDYVSIPFNCMMELFGIKTDL
jgi:hypothetical protein